ncbi:hypothetical protein FB45DRAFT_759813 [Roridomyces roridus]|uniref:Uncharacterized protein n=1 Tax=Roridomyces roridus TaxID=1738132 RepID=A0AAD7B722_9AGAR|nr:hypothetical protein FB45DRAFT_759813 [Roridomyces roridus]
MRFTSRFIFNAAVLALASYASAQTFVAFSGDTCNGDEGADVVCNGDCGSFSGRHSFHVLGSSASVLLFEGDGCTGEGFNFGTETAGECINVNTGTPISSFICG